MKEYSTLLKIVWHKINLFTLKCLEVINVQTGFAIKVSGEIEVKEEEWRTRVHSLLLNYTAFESFLSLYQRLDTRSCRRNNSRRFITPYVTGYSVYDCSARSLLRTLISNMLIRERKGMSKGICSS